MTDSPQSKLSRAQEEISALIRDLRNLAETLDQQQIAIQRLQNAWAAAGRSVSRDPNLNSVMSCTDTMDDKIQQINVLLPQFEISLNELQTELVAQEKEHEQLAALYNVSQAVNSTLDLGNCLNLVMDMIISVTGAERGFLMLIDEQTGELTFRVARNMDQETIEGSSFEISRSIVNRVAEERKPIVTTNAQADPRFSAQASVVSYSLRSILCVPLIVKDKITGVIYADNRIKAGLFSDRDRDLLAAFANQAAVAIENARLFESVKRNLEEISNMKNLMDNVFASIASGVITTDIADQITLFNRAAESILGIAEELCIGRSYSDVLPDLRRTSLPALIEEVKAKERKYIAYEIEPYLPQRGTVNLSMNLSPLKDAKEETLGVAIVVDDLTEKKKLEALRDMFRRYVSPTVIEELLSDPDKLKLGGQRQEISILFADIREFTSFSEKLPPEELVGNLNRYLSLAAQAVLEHEGTLDKFMGDAVMALFNAPLPQEDHALRAVKAALKMQQAIAEYHKSGGGPQLSYGVGINLGEAVVGNIGTAEQMNYTAIGHSVNLAKRLQESAGGGQILLSNSAYQRVRYFVIAKPLGAKQFEGLTAFEQVYELTGLKG